MPNGSPGGGYVHRPTPRMEQCKQVFHSPGSGTSRAVLRGSEYLDRNSRSGNNGNT
jgi:hypothetical protein